MTSGVDSVVFVPSFSREWLRTQGFDVQKKVILFVGNLLPIKGTRFLLEAIPEVLSRHSDCLCVIVGDGVEHESLKRMAYELNVHRHVHFVGRVEPDEMPRVYASADVVVMPSLMESASIALLEGMSCGKPVIATNVGGTPNLIQHGQTGLLVPPASPQPLAEAIVETLGNEELRHRLGENARKRIEYEFDWTVIVDQIEEIYHYVAGENRSSGTGRA